MVRAWRSAAALWVGCIALLICASVRAGEGSPEELLKGKGLTKTGIFYLTEADGKLPESLKSFRAIKKQLDDDNRKRADLESKVRMAKGAIAGWEQEFRAQNEKLPTAKDVFTNNKIVGAINSLASKIKEGTEFKQQQESELAKLGNTRDQYVTAVLDLAGKFEEIGKGYEKLASDASVKGALDKINEKARPKVKLGPSVDYTSNVFQIKKQRDTIKSDIIPITVQGQVHHVDVNFNGKITRSLVLDSGASYICLTADTAKMLDMIPGADSEVMKMQLADGKLVDARHMVIKSVRVGQFTVENVDCAVLPADLVAADNLLGGSFLKNFIYKIDPQAGELHLSQIGGKPTPGGASDKPPSAGSDSKPSGNNPLDKKTAPGSATKPAGNNPLDKKPETSGPTGGADPKEILRPATGDGKPKKFIAATASESQAAIAKAKAEADEVEKKLGIKFGTLETSHFLIFSDWDPREFDFLKTNLEAAYTAVSQQFEIPVTENVFIGRLPVYMFAKQSTFQTFANDIDSFPAPSNLLGYYRGNTLGFGHMSMWKPDVVGARGDTRAAERKWARVLTHEFTHAFVARYRTNSFIPRWLNEGVAEVVSHSKFPDPMAHISAKDSASSRNNIQRIFHDAGSLAAEDYPVAQTMVETMIAGNPKAFLPYFNDLKDGVEPSEALMKHFQVDSNGLEKAWRRYLAATK